MLFRSHGNRAHITLSDMRKAAHAADIDVERAADNIHQAARAYRAQGGEARPGAVATASGMGPQPHAGHLVGDVPAGEPTDIAETAPPA